MKNQKLENGLILFASILFYSCFWGEGMGLNVLIFSFSMIGILLFLNPQKKLKIPVIITGLGTLITAVLVVWNNSLFSKVIHLLSFTTMVGFAKQSELKLFFYGFFLSVVHFLRTPYLLLYRFLNEGEGSTYRLAPVLRSLRLSVLPVLVVLLFYGLYSFSNARFRAVSNNFWDGIGNWLAFDISFWQVAFYLIGLILVSTILLKSDFNFFRNAQILHKVNLERRRRAHSLSKSMIALKSVFQSGLGLLYALNALLFIVNFLDIRYVWFSGQYELSPVEFSSMVHDGTNMLIVALLLAMVVISILFNRNLNFYPRNNALKILAYLWIAQNAILAISVVIKNWQYIEANGLAYKRIGVLIFLALVFFGLITLFWKVKEKRTFYYLLHRNTWAAYALFVFCAFINWDIIITKHNLQPKEGYVIDYNFLLYDVSDKNLYLFLEQEKTNPDLDLYNIQTAIKYKKQGYLARKAGTSWLSWNYADHKNSQVFIESTAE